MCVCVCGGEGVRTYDIVFFSVVLTSGRARLSTFSRAAVRALIRECRYA